MSQVQEAQQLANYVLSLPGFSIDQQPKHTYDHMGAVIADTILQAGLNYRTVVEPRVRDILHKYPEARTTSMFYSLIGQIGVGRVLNWKHHEKISRVFRLTRFFMEAKIEEEEDLRNWLDIPDSIDSLLKLKGIGLKTVDYLKNLVGIPSVAVDRHIRSFITGAGIRKNEYMEIRTIVENAADLLSVSRQSLDHAIWLYLAEGN